MNEFKILFGVSPFSIKKTCIIAPIISKEILAGLRIPELKNGKLYSTGENELFTLIRTGMGCALTGDAVLYLKDTGCENIVLFGSCGAVNPDMKSGDLVAVKKTIAAESFTNMLCNVKQEKYFNSTLSVNNMPEVTCLTVGSLKLEEQFVDNRINIVDMEASALYAAANHIGRKAIAILFVCDILKIKLYYDITQYELKKLSKEAAEKVYSIIAAGKI